MSTVANTIPEYEDMVDEWKKCRDAISGQKAIRKGGEDYLPRLSGQDDQSYEKYLKQALFYNASGRTHQTYLGMIFRKEPAINVPTGLKDFLEDVDRNGTDITKFANQVTDEELTVSRIGILVDYPRVDSENMTVKQAEEAGIRSYFSIYKAESIIGYKQRKIGNKSVLTQVRLKEERSEEKDEFEDRHVEQYRVLELAPTDSGLAYRQRVFVKNGQTWQEDEDQTYFPKISGEFIREIPFYIVGGIETRNPEMVDLIDVNISHYIAEADHRKGVAWTTRPQPYATGVNKDEIKDLTMGGEEFWYSENPEANFSMMEYSGKGLVASENLIDRLEDRMSVLGARMLLGESDGDETATEFLNKKQGENSALGDVSDRVSEAITQALQFAARWMGMDDDEIEFRLNKDYIPATASPDDILKMIQAVQSGRWLEDDMLWWAEQNEVLDPSISNEERKQQMQTSPPAGM